MSTSPNPASRSRRFARATFFATALLVAVTSTTAIAGLEPSADQPALASRVAQSGTELPVTAQAARLDVPIPANPCSPFHADFCVEVPLPAPERVVAEKVASCRVTGPHDPAGTLEIASGTAGDPAAPNAVRIRFEVETGLAINENCFADTALAILRDERGWSITDDVTFVRVDGDSYDLRLVLASPAKTDSLCYPADTAGKYSCRKQDTVIINLMRWETGADDFEDDLTTYRRYLINHEVGHFLGRGHRSCPGAGELAPVMMQQTKGLGECRPNGWPTKDEN